MNSGLSVRNGAVVEQPVGYFNEGVILVVGHWQAEDLIACGRNGTSEIPLSCVAQRADGGLATLYRGAVSRSRASALGLA